MVIVFVICGLFLVVAALGIFFMAGRRAPGAAAASQEAAGKASMGDVKETRAEGRGDL